MKFKIGVLLLISLIPLGSYFTYDAIASLQKLMIERLNIDEFRYSILFSIYTFPNILIVLLGGLLIDKLGPTSMTLLFCTFVYVGILLMAITNIYWLVIIGMFIFGIGAESSYTAQNVLCTLWFRKKHLAKAFAITTSFLRLGSILAWLSAVPLANHSGTGASLWLATAICFISFSAAFIYFLKYNEQKTMKTVKTLKSIRKLPYKYWLLMLGTITSYAAIFSFRSLGSLTLTKNFNLEPQISAIYISLIDILSLFLTPFFGWMVDKMKNKVMILTITSNILALNGYLLLNIQEINPLISIVLLGLYYSIFPATVWPLISKTLNKKYTGISYSIISFFQSILLTGFYPLFGHLMNYGYFVASISLMTLSTISITLILIILIKDNG